MANANGFQTKIVSQTGTGSAGPIIMVAPGQAGTLQPAIGLAISGTVNATVQWSGDDPQNYGTATWFPFTNLDGITATTAGTVGAAMTMLRITVNSGSGTATMMVCQQTAQGG